MVERIATETLNEIEYFAKKGEGYVAEENEDLVELIQLTDKKKYWDKLYHKTENLVHSVYHRHVNQYYKNTAKEDIYQILYIGWVRAVKFYNRKKATGKFHAVASFLINQAYVQFAKKITKDKDGSSVKHQLLCDVSVDETGDSKEKSTEGVVSAIMKDDSTEKEIKNLELHEFVKEKLNILKRRDHLLYELVYKHIFEERTQKSLCEEYKLNATTISRKIKMAYEFLRNLIKPEELLVKNYAY